MPTLAEIRQQYPQYEDMSDDALARALHQKFYSDMSPNEFNAKVGFEPNKVEDVAKSAGAGIVRGGLDLAGMPGTLQEAMSAGGEWLMRQAGLPTRSEAMRERGLDPSNPLGGQSLKRAASAVTGGATDYQPLTTEGEYARTGGEFLPAALTGPGGVIRKTAMATVPAASSEGAGQMTRGTALEPWARVAGAIVPGIGVAGMQNPIKQAAKGAPTREALKGRIDKLYGGLREAGIRYDADTFARTVQSARDELLEKGLRPVGPVKEAFDYLDELQRGVGTSPSFDDINAAVQAVGRSARSAQDGNARLAFNIVRDKLDDFESAAPLITTKEPLSQAMINRVRQAARGEALKNIKQRTLDEIVENADTYQSGVEAGIRNQISNLLRSKKGKQLFSGAERTALLQVAQGRKPLQMLSRWGLDLSKMNLGGSSALLPTAAAYMEPTIGVPLMTAGTAAKVASPRMTSNALERTGAAIRSGGLLGPAGERAQGILSDQTLRRLLLGPMAVSAATE